MKLLACVAVGAAMLQSCSSGSSEASSETMLFGTVPGIYEQFSTRRGELKEKLKSSPDDGEQIKSDYDKLHSEYATKLEEAAKALDGKTLDIIPGDDFKITAPVSLTFEKFFSDSDLTPAFDVAGEIVTTKDLFPEGASIGIGSPVYIVYYDAAGNELNKSRIGFLKPSQQMGDKIGVPAGSTIKFDRLQFSPKRIPDYTKTASMKISL